MRTWNRSTDNKSIKEKLKKTTQITRSGKETHNDKTLKTPRIILDVIAVFFFSSYIAIQVAPGCSGHHHLTTSFIMPELILWSGSNPACWMSKICNDQDVSKQKKWGKVIFLYWKLCYVLQSYHRQKLFMSRPNNISLHGFNNDIIYFWML